MRAPFPPIIAAAAATAATAAAITAAAADTFDVTGHITNTGRRGKTPPARQRVKKVAMTFFEKNKFDQPEAAGICKELVLQADSVIQPCFIQKNNGRKNDLVFQKKSHGLSAKPQAAKESMRGAQPFLRLLKKACFFHRAAREMKLQVPKPAGIS